MAQCDIGLFVEFAGQFRVISLALWVGPQRSD
jgi:hypothetical protein